jgi:sodium-dependent dicarboxylate transporter 2/3/5
LSRFTAQFKVALAALIFVILFLAPAPAGLSTEAKKVTAIAALAVVLWITEAVHPTIVGLIVVILLALTAAVPTLKDALYGFSQPLVYFLFGVYVMAFAAAKSGLAERTARWLLTRSRGRIKNLYFQLVASFALFSFLVPSATTRNSIQIPAIDEALKLAGFTKKTPAPRIIMLSLAALNRLGSTALLTGGIAPVAAAAFLGNFSWDRWFILMAPVYYLMLAAGGFFIYFLYRPKNGYPAGDAASFKKEERTFGRDEWKVAAIMAISIILWATESLHHQNSALVALIGAIALLLPGFGVLNWREMESNISWSSLYLMATSLCLGQAFTTTGAAAWFAEQMVNATGILQQGPHLQLLLLMAVSSVVRLGVPEISAVYSIIIPFSVVFARQVGLNPLLCGLVVTIIPDAAIFFAAQSASSVVVYEKGWFTAYDLVKVALGMTAISYLMVFFFALPYWNLLGELLVAR